jgi:small subunit ribosomal protein S16
VAVKLRLMRMGKKKQPTYRIVAADSRSPRNGRFIEIIGTYDPRKDPSGIELDSPRAVEWLIKGAKASDTVRKLLEHSGAWGEFREQRPEKPAKPGRKRKATTAKKAAKKVKKAPAKAATKAKKATAKAPAVAPEAPTPAEEAAEPTPAATESGAVNGDATTASTDSDEAPTEGAETAGADEEPQTDDAPVEAG